MRQLAIAVLGVWLATSAVAQAQGTFGGPKKPSGTGSFGGPNGSAPAPGAAPTYGAPQPYKPHTAPAAPKSPGNTDGGEPFKPFKGSSVYSDRGGVDPYKKPAKPKSIYDR